jgi:hypothetical protein
MGRMSAEEMVANADTDVALRWHLATNHYPAVHPVFLPIARQAISLANQGDWHTEIVMPNGITKTVSGIIDGLHLSSFLDENEDYSDYE